MPWGRPIHRLEHAPSHDRFEVLMNAVPVLWPDDAEVASTQKPLARLTGPFHNDIVDKGETPVTIQSIDPVTNTFQKFSEFPLPLPKSFLTPFSIFNIADDNDIGRLAMPGSFCPGDLHRDLLPVFSACGGLITPGNRFSLNSFSQSFFYFLEFGGIDKVLHPGFKNFLNAEPHYFGGPFVSVDMFPLAGSDQDTVIGVFSQGPEVVMILHEWHLLVFTLPHPDKPELNRSRAKTQSRKGLQRIILRTMAI